MTLFRIKIPQLVPIDTIIFDNYVNLTTKIEIPPNDYIFTENDIYKQNTFQNIIKYFNPNEFAKYKNNQNITTGNTTRIKTHHKIKLEDLKKMKLNKSINSIIDYNEDKFVLHKNILV